MKRKRWSALVLTLPLLLSCTEGTECDEGNPLMPMCTTGAGPDEPRLLFQSNRAWPGDASRIDLYTSTSRGTQIRRITHNGAADLARWSPDGRHIAYGEWTAAGNTNIVVIEADGSNPRNISNQAVVSDALPSWSPDGRRIAFHSNRHNVQGGARRSIYVMDADGGNVVRLTTNNAWNDRYPSWSPDGTKIAFMSNRTGGVMQIFVMNADGTNPQQLTTQGANFWPHWSPDGKKISFSGQQRVTDGVPDNGLYIMNPDGSEQTNLTRAGTLTDMHSTWSPDGRELYFCSTRTGMHIWRVGLMDRMVRPLTNPGSMDMEASPHSKRPLR